MLSEKTAYILEVALSNEKVADELAARLISTAPADAAAAQQVLSILDTDYDKKIEEYLIIALTSRTAGKEIAQKVNALIAVLEAQADGQEVAAVAAQFQGQVTGMTTNVTIDADVAGIAGNVTLTANGGKDIDTLIAEAGVALTLSVGDGSQVPTADIVLSGGADASDANLVPAQTAMGSEHMSDATFERLVVAMASRSAAQEFKQAFDAMIDAAQSI